MYADTGYEKLKEAFPNAINGYIGCKALAIVGQFGFELCGYTSPASDKWMERFEENDQVNIVEFHKEYLLLNIGHHRNYKAPYRNFKGFKFVK